MDARTGISRDGLAMSIEGLNVDAVENVSIDFLTGGSDGGGGGGRLALGDLLRDDVLPFSRRGGRLGRSSGESSPCSGIVRVGSFIDCTQFALGSARVVLGGDSRLVCWKGGGAK